VSPTHVVVFLAIGGLAGWFAGILTKGRGFGPAGNMVVGIAGAFLGGFCFSLLGIAAYGFLGRLIFATLGALLFTWLLGFVRR
jgi:uncharacterized membrane protein YeaQ/YmgE (transglycosylase-associated protein family)